MLLYSRTSLAAGTRLQRERRLPGKRSSQESGTLVFSSLLFPFPHLFPRCDPHHFLSSSVERQNRFPHALVQWKSPHEDTNRCLLSLDPPAQVSTWRSAAGAR